MWGKKKKNQLSVGFPQHQVPHLTFFFTAEVLWFVLSVKAMEVPSCCFLKGGTVTVNRLWERVLIATGRSQRTRRHLWSKPTLAFRLAGESLRESTSQRDGWMGREARLVVAPTQNYMARLWAVLSVTPELELLWAALRDVCPVSHEP